VNFSVALCAQKLKVGRIVGASAAHLDDVMDLKNHCRPQGSEEFPISQAGPAECTTIVGESSDQIGVDFAPRLAVLIRFRDPPETINRTTD
jgi:hypothetical protein